MTARMVTGVGWGWGQGQGGGRPGVASIKAEVVEAVRRGWVPKVRTEA